MQDLLITLSRQNRALAAKKLLYCVFFLTKKHLRYKAEREGPLGERGNLFNIDLNHSFNIKPLFVKASGRLAREQTFNMQYMFTHRFFGYMIYICFIITNY